MSVRYSNGAVKETSSRRQVLAAAAAATSGALAGCGSFGLLGGSGGGSPDDWLLDPGPFEGTARPSVAGSYAAPSSLESVADHLSFDPRLELYRYPFRVDPTAVDWAIGYSGDVLPTVSAAGGSFGADEARDAETASDGETRRVAGFDVVEHDESWYSAYRNGEAARLSDLDGDVERILEAVDAGEDWPSAAPDSVGALFDAVGFEHATVFDVYRGPSIDDPRGTATGYEVSGETTTVSRAHLNGPDASTVEARAESIDELREVSVETDDPLIVLTATVDTADTSLRGDLFRVI